MVNSTCLFGSVRLGLETPARETAKELIVQRLDFFALLR